MPRYITRRKHPLLTTERLERARRYRVRGTHRWFDPFPNVAGTLPEKMVYAELMERGVHFHYQSYWDFVIPEIGFDEDYRPDFIIPGRKQIIEVQGAYWHSMPDQIEDDAFKFAVYEMKGWEVLVWWDYEIFDHLDRLFAQANFPMKMRRGKQVKTGREANRSDSKGIVTGNKRRRRSREPTRKYKRKSSKSLFGYEV